MKKLAFVKYTLAMLLFGSNGIVASYIGLSSYEIVLWRTFIGALLLTAIFKLSKGQTCFWREKRQFAFLIGSGVAMAASWMFLFEAYRHIGVSLSSLLYYCGPVIVMALSPLLFREKLTWTKTLGFLAVIGGVLLVNGQITPEQRSQWGIFCGLMSAATYALMIICNKKASRITGLENAMLQMSISFLAVLLFTLLRQGHLTRPDNLDLLPLLLLGVLNTGGGGFLYFSSLNQLPAQTVAVCGYLELVSAVIFAAIFLREALSPLQIIGALLIIGGAMLGECCKTKPAPADQTSPA
ncbi:MAG: DMT family transporter [Lentisphaerae bacterium]|jgi:drug/metabolite transporter (DMT)-like permease|nr:DMT family transporter [Lentisphaerota bacterium]